MLRFNNDYNRGAHPEILKAFIDTNDTSYAGYGTDEVCKNAKTEIKKYLNCQDADIHFLVGGTQANVTVIQAALKPYECVLSSDAGHINVHETGALEHAGHKIIALAHKDGKITAEQVEKEAVSFETSDVQEHITCPRLVYISLSTEYGTVYSKAELCDLYNVCKQHGLYLFVDGARLGYGLNAAGGDITLADLAKYSDVFYIGGTKCGAMFGEAVVIINDALKPYFRSYIKQNGGMLAKGWTLGLQFYTLFKDGLYFEITKKAVDLAQKIKAAFVKAGIELYIDSPTNILFVAVNDKVYQKLSNNYYFENEGVTADGKKIIRFCVAWSTPEADVLKLIEDIGNL